MQIISLSKVYTLLLVLGAVALVAEAGPTPKKPATPAPATKGKTSSSLTNRVCHPLGKGFSKYRKPIPAGKKEKPPKGGAAGATNGSTKSSTKAPAAAVPAKKIKRDAEFEGSELVTRAYTPAKASGTIKLYHGAEADLTGKVDLTKGSQGGDFGGPAFYMTDRERAALQFACLSNSVFYQDTQEEIDNTYMHVIEYEWTGAGANIHTFTGTSDADWKPFQDWAITCSAKNDKYEKIYNSDMIVGPMQKEEDIQRKITSNFWQYVVMNQAAADKHLKRIGSKKLKCEPNGRGGNFD